MHLHDYDRFLEEGTCQVTDLTSYELEGVTALRNIRYQENKRKERERRAQDNMKILEGVPSPRKG